MYFITDEDFGIIGLMFDDELKKEPEIDEFMEAVKIFSMDNDREYVRYPEDMSEKQKRIANKLRIIGVHAKHQACAESGKSNEEILKECHELWVKKNHDYGNSFAETRKIYKDAILVRLTDKLGRLKVLVNSGEKALVENESIVDTLIDIFNYAVMELIEMLKDIRA